MTISTPDNPSGITLKELYRERDEVLRLRTEIERLIQENELKASEHDLDDTKKWDDYYRVRARAIRDINSRLSSILTPSTSDKAL